MANKKSKNVQDELHLITKANYRENELVFDTVTGELVVKKRYEKPENDSTVIDQLAEDGFM